MKPGLRHTWQDLPVLMQHPLLWRHVLLPLGMRRNWWLGSRLASFYRRTAVRGTRIVAVVGSVGKTTTTRAVAVALGAELPQAYLSSFGNGYHNVGLGILGLRPSDSIRVVEAGIKRPNQMAPMAEMLRPDVTVVTAVTSSHHEQLKTLERTRAEKAEMVRALPSNGTAILNGDDPNVRWMASQTAARVVTFGFDANNDVRADGLVLHWPDGMQFSLHTKAKVRDVQTRLLARHQVYALLAAVAAASTEGIDLDDALAALSSLTATPGRMQPVPLPNGALVLRDDCKADQESIEAALDFLAAVPAARRGVVLGEMGLPPGDPEEVYQGLGGRVADIASFAILVGDAPSNPAFLKGAQQRGLAAQSIQLVDTILEAIQATRKGLRPGDVVLLKGTSKQRLGRVSHGLEGQTVRCNLLKCRWSILCEHCPRLARGWPRALA